MRPRRRQTIGADTAALPPPQLPVQTTFRHMATSPAVAARIAAEARKLQRYCARITACHVTVLAPHRHRRQGRHYAVHIDLAVPGERLVISHEHGLPVAEADLRPARRPSPGPSPKEIHPVIRGAFDAARRRLEDYVRRLRGDVKHHQPPGEID